MASVSKASRFWNTRTIVSWIRIPVVRANIFVFVFCFALWVESIWLPEVSSKKFYLIPEIFINSDLNPVFFLVSLGGVRLSPLGTSATVGLLYQPRMIDDDYGAVSGMRTGKGNRSTRRKLAPVTLCPPQIPHDLTWDRTLAAAVGSQRLTAWAMTRPRFEPKYDPWKIWGSHSGSYEEYYHLGYNAV
jgi:hypothetical protein